MVIYLVEIDITDRKDCKIDQQIQAFTCNQLVSTRSQLTKHIVRCQPYLFLIARNLLEKTKSAKQIQSQLN